MTGFDFAIIAIVLVSLLIGLWRGLVYEVLSLVGWPVALISSKLLAVGVVPMMPDMQESARLALAYATVFIAVLIVWGVLAWLLSRLVKSAGLGWLDRSLGALFGVLRGLLVILVLVWLAGLTSVPEQPFWRNARTSKMAEGAALLTKDWLPDNIARRIRYGTRG